MRGVFSGAGRAGIAWLLILVLFAPAAFASDPAGHPGLWAKFLAWLGSRLDIPGGAAPDAKESFTVWLMSRWAIPGG